MRCSDLACDDRFDRRAAAEFTFDGLGDAASLAGDVDLERVVGRGVVAAIAAVGDDASEVGADLRLDLRDDGGERMAVIGVAGQRLGVGDELAAPERWRVVASETLTPNS